MFTADLFETPERDLSTLRYAERAVSKLGDYLRRKNEDVPLKDCGFRRMQTGPDDIWLFPVTDAGLPHRDVWFGVGWQPGGHDANFKTQAYATTGRNAEGDRLSYLIMLLADNPENDTDVVFKFRWQSLIHEMIHILDYRRGLLRHKDNVVRAASIRGERPKKPDPSTYYNSPIEFNAYYQQGMYGILNMLSRSDILDNASYQLAFRRDNLLSFDRFQGIFMHEFDWQWVDHWTPATRRRFLRRFYKLYELVRDQWPNMIAINDVVAERKAIEDHWAKEAA